jgi:hypothetical protein
MGCGNEAFVETLCVRLTDANRFHSQLEVDKMSSKSHQKNCAGLKAEMVGWWFGDC